MIIIYRYPDHVATHRYTWIPPYLGPPEKRSGRVPKYHSPQSSAPLDADILQDGFSVIQSLLYHPEDSSPSL